MNIVRAIYSYHAIGQGLFASSQLSIGSRHFHWIYDCGTVSKDRAKLIDNAIDRMLLLRRSSSNTKPFVDLLVVSHFDADHINGVLQLLKRVRVGTLMLPYFDLWQRLIIAFADPARASFVDFCTDPAAFLNALAEASIDRIVFVPPSDPDERGSVPMPPISDGPRDFEISFKRADLGAAEYRDDPMLSSPPANVEMLAPSSGLTVGGFWEFVPYSDPKAKAAPRPNFKRQVDAFSRVLIGRRTDQQKKRALSALKALFDRTFARGPTGSAPVSSRARNRISLCLYAGPIDPSSVVLQCALVAKLSGSGSTSLSSHPYPRAGQMFTGDAFLKSKAATLRFSKHFDSTRLARLAGFQVMHHGADTNHGPHICRIVRPTFSVFSSDPTESPWHPHASAKKAFSSISRTVQVDLGQEFHLYTRVEI